MIDLNVYRCRVGLFCGGLYRGIRKRNTKNKTKTFLDNSAFSPHSIPEFVGFCWLDTNTGLISENVIHSPLKNNHTSLMSLLYIYFILTITTIMLSLISSPNFTFTVRPSFAYLNIELFFLNIELSFASYPQFY